MAVARKHHYLPQMYLTGFANDKDQCFVVDASTRKAFTSSTAKIAKEQDYNTIEIQGVPADALEKELGKLEGVIAPGIKRVRETASFGASGENREDIINLITLLAVRNPCARHDNGQKAPPSISMGTRILSRRTKISSSRTRISRWQWSWKRS